MVLLAAAGTEVPAADILVARTAAELASGTEAVLEQLMVPDSSRCQQDYSLLRSASIFVQVSSV